MTNSVEEVKVKVDNNGIDQITFKERNHIENLLSTRFNFFLLIFASIIASIFAVNNINQLIVILIPGSIVEILFALVLLRSDLKLGILLEELKGVKKGIIKFVDKKANKGSKWLLYTRSKRKLIGTLIPLIISGSLVLATIFTIIFPDETFTFLNPDLETSSSGYSYNLVENDISHLDQLTYVPDEDNLFTLIIGFIAIAISLLSLIIVIRNNRKNNRMQKANFFIDRYYTYESKLTDWPEAFKFYDVDLDKAESNGVKPEQITYLILYINTLQAAAQFKEKKIKKILLGSYYIERMFSNQITRKAWEYAKNFFGDKTIEIIDNYLKEKYPEDYTKETIDDDQE